MIIKNLAMDIQKKQYKIYFTNTEINHLEENEVWINNVLDLRKFVYCIGTDLTIIFDEYTEANYKEIVNMYRSGKLEELSNELNCNYRAPEEALDILPKIHIPIWVQNILISSHTTIDKHYVHKTHEENVLISSPVQTGNLYYFKGFQETNEIQIDHESDHLDGIKIFEVSRQASIAAMASNGFPVDGINILTKNSIEFKNFIDKDNTFFIQTLPAVKPNGGSLYCAFSVIQYDRICAIGYFAGVGFNSKEEYFRKRKEKANQKC